jgi:hypothetical protein
MSITFLCEHCQKEIKAPDASAGKRGKCPFCQQSVYVPAPAADEELIPLAPIDEEEERRSAQRIKELVEQDRELIAQTGSVPEAPLEQQEDMAAEDLYHLVVNYCLDLTTGKLDRAGTHVAHLRKFGFLGQQAVGDFLSGRAEEDALNTIPKPVLKGFLNQLLAHLK